MKTTLEAILAQHKQLVDDEAQAQKAEEDAARVQEQANSQRKGYGRGGGRSFVPAAPSLAAFVPAEILSQENKAANAPPTQWQVPSSIIPFASAAQSVTQLPAPWQSPASIPPFVPAELRVDAQPWEPPVRAEASGSAAMNLSAEQTAALRKVTEMGFDADQAHRVLMSHGWLVDAAIQDLIRDNS